MRSFVKFFMLFVILHLPLSSYGQFKVDLKKKVI